MARQSKERKDAYAKLKYAKITLEIAGIDTRLNAGDRVFVEAYQIAEGDLAIATKDYLSLCRRERETARRHGGI